jgi:hypothetical protein
MDNPTLLLLLLVSDTHDFYLPLEMISYQGQLRCEEKESSHQLDGFERCVLDRESGMPEEPEFKVGRSYIYIYIYIYIYMCVCVLRMHRKPQLNPLNFCYTHSVVHF